MSLSDRVGPEAARSGAYRELAPPAQFRDLIECFWQRDAGAARSDSLVLPDGCIDIIWAGERPPLVAGPATAPIAGKIAARIPILGLRFRPGAARTLLRIDATEIVDRHVPLEEIWPRQWAARWAEANGQPVAQATLAAVLATIGNELAAATPPDPLIRHVVYRMASRPGISVEEIARDAGLSDRHLRRRMRQSVGYGPKTLQRILRLQRLLWLASADEPHAPNLTRLAFTAGYADQPHMTREVAALTGATPRHVLLHSRRASAVSELFKTLAGEDARL
jgi:AraC-like DNA-binding protein